MLATRSVYTKHVVSKLKADKVEVGFSPEFSETPGQIPLPATIVHRISDAVNEKGLYTIDLISPWPINPDKALSTEWEREAIASLIAVPESSIRTTETVESESNLRFMSADFGSVEACVACHNAHPDSPRTDFQLGDMMGALVVEIPLNEEFAAAQTTALWITSGLAVSLGILVTLILVFLRKVVIRPVQQLGKISANLADEVLPDLAKVMGAVAAGDLTSQASFQLERVKVNSKDEIGAVANSFNSMVDRVEETGNGINKMIGNLRELIGRLDGTSNKLAAASGQLATSAEQANAAAQVISSASQQVAEGAEQQSLASQEITLVMSQLASVIDEVAAGGQKEAAAMDGAASIVMHVSQATADVASSAQAAADGSHQADEAARNGADMMEKTVAGMGRIKSAVDSASGKNRRVGSAVG